METKNMNLYNISAVDTDSIKIYRKDGLPISEEDRLKILFDMNYATPSGIVLEEDGYYEKMLVVKSKNYVTVKQGKLDVKGSALKATMKEPALQRFINDVIMYLIEDKQEALHALYNNYARAIGRINASTIADWASKKTVTKSVLNPKRTNEARVKESFAGMDIQEGDKINVFYRTEKDLELVQNFNGEYCQDKLYKKLHASIKIFETLIDTKLFPNYSLKKNKELLANLIQPELGL